MWNHINSTVVPHTMFFEFCTCKNTRWIDKRRATDHQIHKWHIDNKQDKTHRQTHQVETRHRDVGHYLKPDSIQTSQNEYLLSSLPEWILGCHELKQCHAESEVVHRGVVLLALQHLWRHVP